jgi:hypothetical protein
MVRDGAAVRQGARRNGPPLAQASVFAPHGRRRWWWFAFPCADCAAYHFGRARSLDEVTGKRRAGCGHWVTIMIAHCYGKPDRGAAVACVNEAHLAGFADGWRAGLAAGAERGTAA